METANIYREAGGRVYQYYLDVTSPVDIISLQDLGPETPNGNDLLYTNGMIEPEVGPSCFPSVNFNKTDHRTCPLC